MWLVQDCFQWSLRPVPGSNINVKQAVRDTLVNGLLKLVQDFPHQQDHEYIYIYICMCILTT